VESSVIEFSEQGERTLRSVESSVIEFSEQGERTLRSVENEGIEFFIRPNSLTPNSHYLRITGIGIFRKDKVFLR
ncbi:hypothetical protein, partial [Leptospira santarosai]